jgi:hypothetical protein
MVECGGYSLTKQAVHCVADDVQRSKCPKDIECAVYARVVVDAVNWGRQKENEELDRRDNECAVQL